jgi:hypothetical protein
MAKKPFKYAILALGTLILIAVSAVSIPYTYSFPSTSFELHPYFSYSSQDIRALEALDSDKLITQTEVDHWIQVVFNLVKKGQNEMDATRLYGYLFTAQRDAAALSYSAKKRLAGTLAAVSKQTLCLLLPKKCTLIPPSDEPDAYSLKIAEIVTKQVSERLKEERRILEAYPKPIPPKDWDQSKTYFGSNFGHQKTWLIHSGNQFRPGNPKAYGKEEILLQKQDLVKILSSLTKEQQQLAEKWSAGSGTILTSGQWIALTDSYMEKHHIPLEKSILIRSILAMGLNDATIAYFDTKYTYWKKRPHMLFPDIKLKIKSSSSPSYLSGHATLSMAAAIIMDHYFPENQNQWDKTAAEIAHSRLWGGVHFPIDDQDGLELGRKIGEWIVSKISNK